MTIELDARWRNPVLGRFLEKAIFAPRTARRELAKLKEIAERDAGQPGSTPSER